MPHPQRFQNSKSSHFVTFGCSERRPLLSCPSARDIFEHELERCRTWYDFKVFGYVIMPEHVHLLLSEPKRTILSRALQMLKQNVSVRLKKDDARFWLPRYYDFNVHTQPKHIEKLQYIHRNPVKRGIVDSPEQWKWSSFRHYVTGESGVVEIESDWTARRRGPAAIPALGRLEPQTF